MVHHPEDSSSSKPENSFDGRRDKENSSKVFVASHRRSGTHLTLDTLVANFDYFESGFATFDGQSPKSGSRLLKTHIDAVQASQLLAQESKVIYVVRDGRDVMQSLYNYSKTNEPSIRNMDFLEFLRTPNRYDHNEGTPSLNRVEYWNHHVQSWLLKSSFPVKLVTFDGWKHALAETLEEVGTFLERVPKSNPKSMVMKPWQGWTKKVLRKIGLSKTTAIQFRGGRSQAWKEYFDAESLDYFSRESKETYQLISDKLGRDFEL